MDAEIVAIGSELLTPNRQDTNSLFLTERLNTIGIEVRYKTIVGDRRNDLTSVARLALSRAELVIFMGGLGPTEDDLTRECVAEALGVELQRDPELIAELYKRFASRRMKMPPNNDRQADLLAGAEVLQLRNRAAVLRRSACAAACRAPAVMPIVVLARGHREICARPIQSRHRQQLHERPGRLVSRRFRRLDRQCR